MANKKIDILEIVLKADLKILLEPEERAYLDNLDDAFKQEVFDLVNNSEYADEVEKIATTIIKKASFLPEEQQKYIKEKCLNRVNELKFPSLSPDVFDVSFFNKK